MPTAADKLAPNSSEEQAQAAVSACIQQMSNEHPDWPPEKVQAACINMAKSAQAGNQPGVTRVSKGRIET